MRFCTSFTPKMPYPEEYFAPEAWGVGADYALGAMDSGADAKMAVERAIKREIWLGGPVQVIDLRDCVQGRLASITGEVAA